MGASASRNGESRGNMYAVTLEAVEAQEPTSVRTKADGTVEVLTGWDAIAYEAMRIIRAERERREA